nr:uncharacterized protein LOC111518161 [Leptinotarsa decemlineata]
MNCLNERFNIIKCLEENMNNSDRERKEKITEIMNTKMMIHNMGVTVDEFNTIFGKSMFFSVMFSIIDIVYNTYLGFFYTIFYDDESRKIYTLFGTGLWITVITVSIILISVAGEGLENEARKTPVICYVLLSDIPGIPKTDYQRLLKEELLLIAKQANTRKLCISAAGFFEINLGTIGFVLASVISNIIVAIQFIPDKEDMKKLVATKNT